MVIVAVNIAMAVIIVGVVVVLIGDIMVVIVVMVVVLLSLDGRRPAHSMAVFRH